MYTSGVAAPSEERSAMSRARPHDAQGVSWDGHGTRFAVWSARATAVELCLLEPDGTEQARVALERTTTGLWQAYLPSVGPGQHYGYRAHGRYAPEEGSWFNPNKLLLDPYARALEGPSHFHPALLAYDASDASVPSSPSRVDDARVAPRSLVIDERFDWQGDAPPRTAWADSVIYECHVKGLTALHPEVPAALRGRFLGLSSEPMLAHLRALGVTAVELLPVQHAFSERALVERQRVNYWGYNPIGFFAPDARFRSGSVPGDQVRECKQMVRELHRAGIEVILDVVYNHSGEADPSEPTLCLRGLGNDSYYRLDPRDRARYDDFTGCGNTLELRHPQTLRLVADSLRYWVEHMHVDGFRFDLSSALCRTEHGVEPSQGLFALLLQDPVLSGVKLIAEPWDARPGGMRLGGFPPGVAEWNAYYRDCVRRFFRGEPGQLGELATRLSGSSDLFEAERRGPHAGVSYVSCHDGLTLADLCARDVADANGPSDLGEPPAAERLARRIARSLLTTLAFSLGVPMLGQGDELLRSQRGHDNPYDLDDDTSWVSWRLDARAREMLGYAARCFSLRAQQGWMRRREHFPPQGAVTGAIAQVRWLAPDGRALGELDWRDPTRRALAMWVCGHDATGAPDPSQPAFGLLLNAGAQPLAFHLPEPGCVQLDSAAPAEPPSQQAVVRLIVQSHAACVVRAATPTGSARS